VQKSELMLLKFTFPGRECRRLLRNLAEANVHAGKKAALELGLPLPGQGECKAGLAEIAAIESREERRDHLTPAEQMSLQADIEQLDACSGPS
jgi:hypothetical protein